MECGRPTVNVGGSGLSQTKGHMKKLIMALALAGLFVGCASHERGGTSDQNNTTSGSGSSMSGNQDSSSDMTNHTGTTESPQQ
jgi:hypothetical protein